MLQSITNIWFIMSIWGGLFMFSCNPSFQNKTESKSSPDLLEMISSEPMFWTRIGFTKNPTRLDSLGNPQFYDSDFSVAIRENREFEQAGVKVFTNILHNGWIGVDEYNYSAVDSTLNLILKEHPERYFLPRIKLDVPIEWALENPEDLFVSFNGPRDKNEILHLAKKMMDYWDTGGWSGRDIQTNEGVVGLQSFSSAKWKEDAAEALIHLLKYIENGPYADQIIGYQVAFGSSGETALWGTWYRSNEFKGDFGINHQKEFYKWCVNKYGNLDELRNAWANPELTANNFEIPFLFNDEPEIDKTSLEIFFRANKKAQSKIDYNIFCSQVTADAIEHFGEIVKKETGGKPVGVFYGYLFVQDAAYSGHLAIDQLLKSPYIDFLAAPKQYYRSGPGWPGGEQSPSLSISRKKIWIDELDNRTHLSSSGFDYLSDNISETITILWREVAKNLSYNNQNWWWMDLGGGWFNDSLIMNEITTIVNINKNIRDRKWNSISEILFVIDDKSFTVMDDTYGFVDGRRGGIVCEMESELKLVGAPVETYRLADLDDLPLSQYKLIVFANSFLFEKNQWEQIKKRIPKSSTIIWNYAAGIRKPDYSIDNVKDVTGFDIEPCSSIEIDNLIGYNNLNDFPLIHIVPDSELTVIKRYPNNKIMSAMKNSKGGKVILCAYPYLKAHELREIAIDAGCYMFGPVNCTIYADNRFIGIFPKDSISYDLQFKKEVCVKDAITGKSWNNVEKIPVHLEANSAIFLVVEDF